MGRVVVEDFGGTPFEDPRLLTRVAFSLKALLRGTGCCAVLSINVDWHHVASILYLRDVADGVLSLTPVVDTSDLAQLAVDPASLVSLLKIEKRPSDGSLVQDTGTADVFAVRQKRKRLTIRSIELDPEKEHPIDVPSQNDF